MHARDAGATRARILAAAAEEFAERGRAGARIDAIAARANANKRLIYCYVGDKDELWAEVLRQKLPAFGAATPGPAGDVGEFAGEIFDVLAGDPQLLRLLMFEALELGTEPVPEEEVRRARLAEKLEAIVAAQRSGTVDPDLDPAQTLFSVLALANWWFAAPQLARLLTGEDPADPRVQSRRRAAVVDAARRLTAPQEAR